MSGYPVPDGDSVRLITECFLRNAIIYLKKDDTIIRPQDIPVTKDFRKMVFKSKYSIERIWNFEYDLIQEPGCYDLYIEFFKEKEVIKNYICVN